MFISADHQVLVSLTSMPRHLPRPPVSSPHQQGPVASGLPTRGRQGFVREQLGPGRAPTSPATQRIWVTHHLDTPVPGAGGLSQTEEGNGCQVRVRDVWISSIRGLLQAWRGGRGAPGPRLLCDPWLRGQGHCRRGGQRGALSHVSAEQGAWGRNR